MGDQLALQGRSGAATVKIADIAAKSRYAAAPEIHASIK
jgi:hypothetical protein